ncbi:MAG: rRNA maturation RNAse YbeY, partial [Clostridia bacterium]|nr:rRNA maturation RNAse YbeY [Clostridia bacterium]
MPIVKIRKYTPKPLQINLLGEPECRDSEAEALIVTAARATFGAFAYPFMASVDITLVSDEEIREINREHRQIDRST